MFKPRNVPPQSPATKAARAEYNALNHKRMKAWNNPALQAELAAKMESTIFGRALLQGKTVDQLLAEDATHKG